MDWFLIYKDYSGGEPDGPVVGACVTTDSSAAKALQLARNEIEAEGELRRCDFALRITGKQWYRLSTDVENKIAYRSVDESVYTPCTARAKKTGREYWRVNVIRMQVTTKESE